MKKKKKQEEEKKEKKKEMKEKKKERKEEKKNKEKKEKKKKDEEEEEEKRKKKKNKPGSFAHLSSIKGGRIVAQASKYHFVRHKSLVTHLVEEWRYKPEGRGFDSRSLWPSGPTQTLTEKSIRDVS